MIEEKQVMDSAWRVAAALSVLVLLGSTLPAAAAPDCRARLEFEEEYACEFRSDLSAARIDGTLLFAEFNGNAFQATLDIPGEMVADDGVNK